MGTLGRHPRAAKKIPCGAKRVACGRPLTSPRVAADLQPGRVRRRQRLRDLGRPVRARTDLSKWLLGVCVRCPSQGSHVLCSTSVNGRKQRPDQYVAPALARYPRAAWRGVALSTAAAGPRGSGLFLAGTPASGASCCFFRQETSSILKTYSIRPPHDRRINNHQRRALRAGAFACRHQCTSGCAAKSVDWPPCLRVQHTRCLLVACCGPKGATNL